MKAPGNGAPGLSGSFCLKKYNISIFIFRFALKKRFVGGVGFVTHILFTMLADFLFQIFSKLKLLNCELHVFFSCRTVTTANVIFQHVLFAILYSFALGVFCLMLFLGEKKEAFL